MPITPQLSSEIEKLLPQAQSQLVNVLSTTKGSVLPALDAREIESILLSVGDISLLVKRAASIVR